MDELTRDEVLAALDREQAGWEELVAAVGRERMEEPGVAGDWSFRDVASHLNGWRNRTLERLEAAVAGELDPPPPWPEELSEDDEINCWLDELGRGQDVDTTLAEAAGFDRLRAVVAALPDDELMDPGRFPFLEGMALGPAIASGAFFGHLHDEHEPDIRRWIDEAMSNEQ